MNTNELEDIERRAYKNAVFATGSTKEDADRYIDKIYSYGKIIKGKII